MIFIRSKKFLLEDKNQNEKPVSIIDRAFRFINKHVRI
jgi:hypothetical protein